MSTHLPIMTSGVIHRSRAGMRELLIGKIPGEPFAGKWAFPFGPLDEDVAIEESFRRLVFNQVGLKIRVIFGQPPFDQEWDDVCCRWRFFFCEALTDKVHNSYFTETRWVPTICLKEYLCDPVTQKVADWLLEAYEGQG